MSSSQEQFLNKPKSFLHRLRPDDKSLSLEEREKVYNINLYSFWCWLIIGFTNIVFYLLSSKFPLEFLIYNLIYIGAIIASLFYDPSKRTLFTLLMMSYGLLYGPTVVMLCNTVLIFSMLLSVSMPIFMMYTFRSVKLGLFTLVCEVLKMQFVYRAEFLRMIESLNSQDALEEFFKQEFLIAIPALPLQVGTLFILYVSYNVNMDAVVKITKELERSKTTLAQKELLTLSLSHEARNPLHAIVGNLDMLQEEVKDLSIKTKLRKARMAADILLNLINNFIDAGKIDTGTLEICSAECNLRSFIQNIWMTFEELISTKGLQPRLEISPTIPHIVIMDHSRVAQILYNLVSNAIKFTEKGSVTLKVSFFKPEADSAPDITMEECEELCVAPLKSSPNKSNTFSQKGIGVLRFDVIDTGIGINDEEQKNLFEKWNLPTHSSHKSKLGSGLGLWIIKEICKKLKANIRVTSKLGAGSTFSLFLDVMQVGVDSSNSISLESLFQRLNVLIVDDVSFNAEIIANLIRSFGFTSIKTAMNGLEATRLYEQSIRSNNQIKIITMDLEMPLMNGKEACKNIRNYEKEHNLVPCPVVMISGNCTEGEMKECLDPNGEIGALAFLKKPVKFEDIRSIIQTLDIRNHI